jgi:hypothetical protein
MMQSYIVAGAWVGRNVDTQNIQVVATLVRVVAESDDDAIRKAKEEAEGEMAGYELMSSAVHALSCLT